MTCPECVQFFTRRTPDLHQIEQRLPKALRLTAGQYVKYDLQGRINDFTKRVSRTAPYFENTRIVVEWTETQQNKRVFLDNDRVILRLRREDPDDLNFVHGAYWAVATCLLPKVKRYISPSQRKALDLFVTSKIIEQEKFHVIEHFLEHYLHPEWRC